jgi:glutathione S-transferase
VVELLGLPYSPWSEKARWALDIRGVPYVFRYYAPLVGEPALRWRLGRWRGPVSVPVLTDEDGRAIPDSAQIARWADERGRGPRLFPEGQDPTIARYIALSERGLEAGRSLSLHRLLGDEEGLAEMVPRGVRDLIGPLAPRLGSFGIRRTLHKYGSAEVAPATATLDEVLAELRTALAARPGEGAKTLLATPSFADIAMAQVLAFVRPPAFGLRVGAASRRSFTDPMFGERYPDLLEWRDALYDAYRPRS